MRNKIKYFVVSFILLVLGIISINLFQPNKEQQVKGSIELLVSENAYDYLVECANGFMKVNDKTVINIKKLENYNQITNTSENTKVKSANIAQIDRFNFQQLKLDEYAYYNKDDKLLDNYAKNFSEYRINQVKHDEDSIGIPLTSRPLVFYIREDILKQYKYKREDLNTWDDIIKIGKEIYEKSSGKVCIINATGQDYEDLLDLLTMQIFTKDKSVEAIQLEVQAMVKKLKENNILKVTGDEDFIGRISSINAMSEIMKIETPCQWSAGNVPSIKPGGNKFFATEGDNLLVYNQNADNEKLIEKFITYVITNNKQAVKYVKEGKFFSSYLYTYTSKEIEDNVKNFVGKSPLVMLSNVEEKTPKIEEYDKYIKVKQKLRSDNNNS
ncbi:ABC transporter substrate-binding protein [Clostridium sp. C2-6-12]|uniref:ABC transporter substrate-binding protein n=1 Tax=Clostridium sp. C2-6-12 TaxID=2698832 RepID=UPI0013693078|nr:ABC transporter substrate-binding protein [Clostridium sp. C2-6-12]